MIKAEIFIDVGRSDLAGGDGLYDGGGAGNTVAACKYSGVVFNVTAGKRRDCTPVDRNSLLLKSFKLNALANGDDYNVGFYTDFRLICLFGGRPAS